MTRQTVQVPLDRGTLDGDLTVPAAVRGLVLFAHGSGSSRHSSRNRYVAEGLQEAGFATLLLDLLTEAEEEVDVVTREHRFDIPLLSSRLVAAVDALDQMPGAQGMSVATFGASTGAAAALHAAAVRPDRVRAVVSRGGRPDLAGDDLPRVMAPVLLVVGGNDPAVLELNQSAAEKLPGTHELAVVPGATHLFEEPGALDQVIRLSAEWLHRWMPS